MTAPLARRTCAALAAVIAAATIIGAPSRARASATITIVNGDGVLEGFNDPTPAAPVGGNSGTTLGQQRLIAAQYAADTWAALIDSSVEIRVYLTFDPLTCSASGAVLGSTGPTTVHRDFAGAPLPTTWYVQALANKLAGMDLALGQNDIAGAFNSSVGTTCALPRGWYYGLDASPPGTDLDFVTVALHELAHGLGFVSLVDLDTGAKFNDRNDAFSEALENHSACKLYPSMTDDQRVAASIDTGDLHWVGANVVGASGVLTAGVHPSGHVEMYAPDPAIPGSSVSHFSNACTPNELLEPAYPGPTHDVGLTLQLLLDIGWAGTPPTLLGGQCAGGEFIVNTTGVGRQHEPAVAVDAGGNFVVVWQSGKITNLNLPDVPAQNGFGDGIFGQRFASNGTRLGTEFQVATYTRFGQFDPDVVMTPDGGFVAVWSTNQPDGSDNAVFGRRFDSGGSPVGDDFQINSYTVNSQGFAPKIGRDSGGNFVVVWESYRQDGSDWGVFGQRFDNAGAKLGNEFQVNTFTTRNQGSNGLSLAVGDDGDFIVVWKSTQQDSPEFGFPIDGGVFGQRFASDGTHLGTEFQVNTYTPKDEGTFGLAVAMDAGGGFVVVWQGPNDGDAYPHTHPYGGILGQRFDSSGAPAGTEFVIDTLTRGLQADSQIAMDAAGGFVVTWEDWRRWPPPDFLPRYVKNEIDVMAQRFDSNGAKLGAQFRVNSYLPQEQQYGRVGVAPDGNFVIVWASVTCEGGATEELCLASQDGMNQGIIGQRYNITAPVCGPTPRTACFGSEQSGLSFGAGALKWKWRKGAPLNLGHFGQPAAGITHYALCVYQAGAATNPILSAAVPPDVLCHGRPCWKASTTGYSYKDSAGAAGGITKIKLKAGEEGKSRILVKASGPSLALPALPLTPYTTLTVQLVNGNEECFEAVYSAPASQNTGSGFKEKF